MAQDTVEVIGIQALGMIELAGWWQASKPPTRW